MSNDGTTMTMDQQVKNFYEERTRGITLTEGQARALDRIRLLGKFTGSRPRIVTLAGLAGTGKSTILNFVPKAIWGMPQVIAPTGKAAARAKEVSGIGNCKTIHSWLYKPSEDQETGDIEWVRKEIIDIEEPQVPLLIIDEGSMVTEDLWNDIYEVCVCKRLNILIVGDPFQLPPVDKRFDDNGMALKPREFSLLSPHFAGDEYLLLTEIVRQALESPIIRASMAVREGSIAKALLMLPQLSTKNLVREGARVVGEEGGVVIVHRNSSRQYLNRELRVAMGKRGGGLEPGEPLLVTVNSYRAQLLNGDVHTFSHWMTEPENPMKVFDKRSKVSVETRWGTTRIGGTEVFLAVEQVLGHMEEIRPFWVRKAWERMYQSSRKEITEEQLRTLSMEEINAIAGPPLVHANLGYALSCHKIQGSENDNVIVCLEPSVKVGEEEGRRWLYTALTRSKQNIWVCMGNPLPMSMRLPMAPRQ